jgi:hypothetical protein
LLRDVLERASRRGVQVATWRIASRWVLWATGNLLVWGGALAALAALGLWGWWSWTGMRADVARQILAAPPAPAVSVTDLAPHAPASSAALKLKLDVREALAEPAAQSPAPLKKTESEPPR